MKRPWRNQKTVRTWHTKRTRTTWAMTALERRDSPFERKKKEKKKNQSLSTHPSHPIPSSPLYSILRTCAADHHRNQTPESEKEKIKGKRAWKSWRGTGGVSVSRALYGGKFFVWQYDVRWSKSSRIFPFSEGIFETRYAIGKPPMLLFKR